MGRCALFDDHPILLHAYSPEHERFITMDAASSQVIIDDLKHIAETAPGQLAKMAVKVGVAYDDEGVLWDTEVMSRIKWPCSAYIDYMHTYVSSGDISQFQINQFVLVLGLCNIDIVETDNWIEQVRYRKVSPS